MRLTLLTWLLVASPFCLASGVYKAVQPDGGVTYTDRPVEGAQEVQLPELQTYTPQPITSPAATPVAVQPSATADGEFAGYKTFAIASPANDATLRDNAGNVSVSLKLEPALQITHTVDIRMDGKSIGAGRGTSISLTNVDRGTHTLEAVVLDASGTEVGRTGSVVFHLNRASIANKKKK